MRLLIDMQGAQTAFSKHRGVGRYTIELVSALIKTCPKEHEIMLAVNGAFPESVKEIHDKFDCLVGYENIKVWQQFFDTAVVDIKNKARIEAGELWRETFLNGLEADIIFSTNLQEGLFDAAVTSVKLISSNALYCTTLHDVTPLLYSDQYLASEMVKKWYMEKINFVKQSDIVLTDSQFSKGKIHELLDIPLEDIYVIYCAINTAIFRKLDILETDRKDFLKRFGIEHEYIMYTGGTDLHKNLERLYRAYAKLPRVLQDKYQIVMVGKELKKEEDTQRLLLNKIGISEKVVFTGFVSDEDLVMLYNCCKIFVFPSISEGFGIPPLEAMSCGAVTLAANATSLPEVVGIEAALFNPYDVDEMAEKIKNVLLNEKLQENIRQKEMEQAKNFSWENSADKLWGVLERYTQKITKKIYDGIYIADEIVERINKMELKSLLSDEDKKAIAMSVAESIPAKQKRIPRIYLDASATVYQDDKTGIQRVTRAICNEIINMEIENYQIEIVYTNPMDMEFYRANELTAKILDKKSNTKEDVWIEFLAGDILLFLDIHPSVAVTHISKIRFLIDKGVKIYYLIHDILPVLRPDCFNDFFVKEFRDNYLLSVLKTKGVICNSKTTAQSVYDFIKREKIAVNNFSIGWFHLGADISKSLPSKGIPPEAQKVFSAMAENMTFLMIGTIEPRKGHKQMYRVFNTLWNKYGFAGNLIIVGRKGWQVDDFIEQMQENCQYNKKLFWLEGISDEYLEKLYSEADCLIAASEGEGFGLPLIEAAQHNISVMARDISIFREVAGENAFYFSGSDDNIVQAVLEWTGLYKDNQQPKSGKMSYLTWRESAKKLLDVIVNDNWWKHLE
jgi:glycosyltransferase involved in cell wall biosynthesis